MWGLPCRFDRTVVLSDSIWIFAIALSGVSLCAVEQRAIVTSVTITTVVDCSLVVIGGCDGSPKANCYR